MHKEKGERVPMPTYLEVYEDITDKEEYTEYNFSKKDYKMSEKDLNGTAIPL
jgi:hypothetical protein